MTKRRTCRVRGPRFPRGAGVTTCVMAREPCTSQVRTLYRLFTSAPPFHHLLFENTALHDHASLTARHSHPSHLIVSYCFAPSHAHAPSPGLTLGGVWGLREGARRPLAVSNARLRINSILNSITRRGTFIGNSAGCLGADPSSFDVFACSPPSFHFQLWSTTASTRQ